jgi:hypothetical protein
MNTDELREALRRDAELAGRPPTDLVPRVAGLRRRSRRRLTGVVGCVLAVAVAVGGVTALDGARGGGPAQDGRAAGTVAVVDTEAAAARFRESIGGGGAGSTSIAPESLIEYLPNTRYRGTDGSSTTLSDAVIVGHVTSVRPGRGFYSPADDDTATLEVPFDDRRAMWRTAHAEVTVTEVLAGQVTEKEIVVGYVLATSAPFDVLAAGFPALGDLVFFLDSPSPEYRFEPDTWRIAGNGTLLAEVEDGGRLTLPAVEAYRVDQFLAVTPTLDRLRVAAQEPTREVPFATLQD